MKGTIREIAGLEIENLTEVEIVTMNEAPLEIAAEAEVQTEGFMN